MMIQIAKSQTHSLRGEVVEMFDRGGQRIAKISIFPIFLEVAAEGIPDAHLGDTVVIDAGITVENIKPVFNNDPAFSES